jgi:hypothetical protein
MINIKGENKKLEYYPRMRRGTKESNMAIGRSESIMCDVKKYSDIFQEIKKLSPDDTLQLVLESKTEEERNFYEMIGDFLLQSEQRDSIARDVF